MCFRKIKKKKKKRVLSTHLLYQVKLNTFSSVPLQIVNHHGSSAIAVTSVLGNKEQRIWLGRSLSTVTLFRFKLLKLVLPENK